MTPTEETVFKCSYCEMYCKDLAEVLKCEERHEANKRCTHEKYRMYCDIEEGRIDIEKRCMQCNKVIDTVSAYLMSDELEEKIFNVIKEDQDGK